MNVKDKVAVVTGGAQGIGLALCTRFAQEGAQVVLSDLKQEACERSAAPIGALPVAADVGREEDIANLVAATIDRFGRIDLFVSNAGIAIDGGLDTPTDKWRKIIDVNLMSEIYAAKYAIPHMLEQGSGYLLNVASAAGLLVIFDTVGYTVTKHAAIGFTEWLAATYDDQGIGVSVLCPAAVLTPILAGKDGHPGGTGRDHHRTARRHRHRRARRGAFHDRHTPVGAREVRGQGARLRRVHPRSYAPRRAADRQGSGLSHAPRRHHRLRVRRPVRCQGACGARRSRWWWSIAPTTTSSNRCSTRSPPACSRRATSRHRSGTSCDTSATRGSSSARSSTSTSTTGASRSTRSDAKPTLSYDSLIVATGASQSYFGHDEYARSTHRA